MIGDRIYRYSCPTCGESLDTVLPIERLPGVIPHPEGGIVHYSGADLCGPLKRVADDTCGLCGRSPAAGWAKIEDTRYCHGDDERPSCYERAQPIYYARMRGETVDADEFRRRYIDGTQTPMGEGP